jgi:hypothetical protein
LSAPGCRTGLTEGRDLAAGLAAGLLNRSAPHLHRLAGFRIEPLDAIQRFAECASDADGGSIESGLPSSTLRHDGLLLKAIICSDFRRCILCFAAFSLSRP